MLRCQGHPNTGCCVRRGEAANACLPDSKHSTHHRFFYASSRVLASNPDVSLQRVFKDLWAVELPACTAWRQVRSTPESPPGRIGHIAVAVGNRILIFGGRNFKTGGCAKRARCFENKPGKAIKERCLFQSAF